MPRKIAGLLLALTILAGVMSVSANDEKKLKVIDMNCDSLRRNCGKHEFWCLNRNEYKTTNSDVIRLQVAKSERSSAFAQFFR